MTDDADTPRDQYILDYQKVVRGFRDDLDSVKRQLGTPLSGEQVPVHEDIASLKRQFSLAKWLVRGAITLALGSVTFVGSRVISNAEHDAANAVKLERAERDVLQLQQEIRDLRREMKSKDP